MSSLAEEKLDIAKRKSAFYEWLKPRVSSALYSDFCVIGEQLNALCVQKRLCSNSIVDEPPGFDGHGHCDRIGV